MSAMQHAAFDRAWKVLASIGACDEIGGAEYRRCLTLWLVLDAAPPLGRFIIAEANRGAPQNGERLLPPGASYRECPHCKASVRAAWIKGRMYFEDHLQWEGPEGHICEWSGECVDTLYIVPAKM